LLAFIGLAVGLRGHFGHVGVSIAVSGSSLVQMALLWAMLARRVPSLRMIEVGGSAARTLAASLAGAGLGLIAVRALQLPAAAGPVGRMIPAITACGVFGVVFLCVAWLLRSPELRQLASGLRRRLASRLRTS